MAYQAPSIIAAGASVQSVSILSTLVNLCLSLICVKAPSLIERMGITKKGAITLAFLNVCVWVPLIVAYALSRMGVTPLWMTILWLINLMPATLLSFQRDNWISNIVPQKSLGRYLGQRLAIRSAFYLGTFSFIGYLLDVFENQTLDGFAIIFAFAFLATFLGFIIYTFMREPKVELGNPPAVEVSDTPKSETSSFGFFSFLGELKAKKLDTFVAFTSIFYLTVNLCGPLYAVYMIKDLHFSYLSYTLIISVEYLARILSAPFWGRYADKVGNIRVLGIASRVIPFIPIAWLFFPNIGYLAFIQALSGVCWGAYDLATQSYIYKVAPQAKKLRYIIYSRSLTLLGTAIGGLMGAYLINGIFPTFGSQILSIFLVSGIFRGLAVFYMLPRLVDLAKSSSPPLNPPQVDWETLSRATASKRGLYYRPKPTPEYATEIRLPTSSFRKKGTITIAKESRLYQPSNQATVARAPVPRAKVSSYITAANSHRGLLYRPKDWTMPSDKKTVLTMPKMEPGLKPRSGLYYDASGWANYMRDSLKAIIRDKKINFAAMGT